MSREVSSSDRPVIVIWEVTQRCMLACQHCRAEAQMHSHPDELDHAQCEILLDQVAEMQPRFFILTGGDPASRSDILEIIAGATRRGLRVGFSPSATPRLLRMNFDDLRMAGVRQMSLSIDGATEESHDEFRGIYGTWNWTMAAYTAARRARIPVQINTTFSRSNIDQFPEFVRLVQQLQPVAWSVFLLVPTGRADLDEMLDADKTETLLEALSKVPAQTGIPVKTTGAPHYRRVVMQSLATLDTGRRLWRFAPTNDGRGCVFISHTGKVRPSGFLPIDCGNIRRESLDEIYAHSPVFRALRDPDRLLGKCRRCEYRMICGGSRARAYAVTGDYLAEEPCCAYQPKGASEVSILHA